MLVEEEVAYEVTIATTIAKKVGSLEATGALETTGDQGVAALTALGAVILHVMVIVLAMLVVIATAALEVTAMAVHVVTATAVGIADGIAHCSFMLPLNLQ